MNLHFQTNQNGDAKILYTGVVSCRLKNRKYRSRAALYPEKLEYCLSIFCKKYRRKTRLLAFVLQKNLNTKDLPIHSAEGNENKQLRSIFEYHGLGFRPQMLISGSCQSICFDPVLWFKQSISSFTIRLAASSQYSHLLLIIFKNSFRTVVGCCKILLFSARLRLLYLTRRQRAASDAWWEYLHFLGTHTQRIPPRR